MPLQSGSNLGPYQITGALGAGAMGEVYRARDLRLHRDVAIKVLPAEVAADPERVHRFEDEARAIATLAHPNILAIHDVGEREGVHYLVTELLEGESLRDALRGGALPPRRAVEYAVQIAAGLAAAHQKGIVHRDLKPENIFLTRDGLAKILDFGLAKVQEGAAPSGEGVTLTSSHTAPGTVMGTAAYMAPEQVRGEATDQRADIFALGLTLYEMLSGRAAFRRDSSVETMNAILKEDAPDFAAGTQVPPALERIVRRCLEKSPEQRFQSAKDMAFALEAISGSSSAQRIATTSARRWRRGLATLAVALAVVAAGALLALRLMRPRAPGPTAITQLTYRSGYIRLARFTPDGQSVIYGAMWDGGPMQLYQGRVGSTDSQPIPTDSADLLSVARTGELAVALDRRFVVPWVPIGTVARLPLMGGAPRPLFQGAIDADWSPDGSALAIVYRSHGRFRLEYPVGKVLYENDGYISHPRFSPDGKRIAFAEHPVYGDDRGWVAVVDGQGNYRRLGSQYGSLQGIAWRPDGREIWSAGETTIHAVDLKGNERVVYRAVGRVRLQDVSPDGKVLVTVDDVRSDIFAAAVGGPESRNLAVLPFCSAGGVSADGHLVAINTFLTNDYEMWIRKVDGSPAVRIGDGGILDLSDDGKMLLGILPSKPDQLILVPTGVGETQALPSVGLVYQAGAFLPDGKHAVVLGGSPGHGTRFYVEDLTGQAPPRAISAEGVGTGGLYTRGVSPDGKYVLALAPESQNPDKPAPTAVLYPVDGGDPRPVMGIEPGEFSVSWLDSRTVLVLRGGETPPTVYKVDIGNGKREVWQKFVPADPTGFLTLRSLFVTPDGTHYVYSTRRVLSTLYVIDGLR